MNVITDTRVRDKYCKGFDRSTPIAEIVIHATGGGSSTESMIEWMLAGERATEYENGVALFHYLTSPDQPTVEIIDPDKWVYHSSSGYHDKETIGIENIKPDSQNKGYLPPDQMQALCELVATLLLKYPSISRIVSHDFNAQKFSGRGPKPCPGDFSWNDFIECISVSGITIEKLSDQEYKIIRG